TFAWVPNSTAADNGGTVIQSTVSSTPGRWMRVVPAHVFNVRHFGAKGDGTTDDSGAIQSAIDATLNGNYAFGRVYFPMTWPRESISTYKITTSLKTPRAANGSQIEFVGEGARHSVILAIGCHGFEPGTAALGDAGHVVFSHLGITVAPGMRAILYDPP